MAGGFSFSTNPSSMSSSSSPFPPSFASSSFPFSLPTNPNPTSGFAAVALGISSPANTSPFVGSAFGTSSPANTSPFAGSPFGTSSPANTSPFVGSPFGTSSPANTSPFAGSAFGTSSPANTSPLVGSGFGTPSGTNINTNSSSNTLPTLSMNSNSSFSSSTPSAPSFSAFGRSSVSNTNGFSGPGFSLYNASTAATTTTSSAVPTFSISRSSTSSSPSSFSFKNVTASSGLQSSASLKADSTAGTTTANASAASTPANSAFGVSSSASSTAPAPAFSASGVASSADTTTMTPACTAAATITASTQAVTGVGATLSASTTTASTPPASVPSFTSPATAVATSTGMTSSAKTSGSLTPASQLQSTTDTSFVGNRRSISSTSMKSNRGSPCSSADPISVILTSENNNSSNKNQNKNKKQVWIWTENKEVMTSAVERGWSTFVFSSTHRHTATDWSSIALICPLFIEDNKLFDEEARLVATISEISSPQQLEQLQPVYGHADNVIVDLLDWQVIPAENIVAAFNGTRKTVFAISKSPSEAQVFLEALEQGLGGVVLKTENVEDVVELKGYLDRRDQEGSLLELTKATITGVQMTGMGDRVCVDLCSLMRPGEGLLVGSFARGLFLVHSECLESNYIASRPFRVNAGPVHAYVAVPGGKTCYLSELKTGKEVLVVDQNGIQRTAVVGRVKIETRPLVIVDAMVKETCYSILLQNAETVGLLSPKEGNGAKVIPVTSLKVGDEVLMRLQGGARHTGIEIPEFIVEK